MISEVPAQVGIYARSPPPPGPFWGLNPPTPQHAVGSILPFSSFTSFQDQHSKQSSKLGSPHLSTLTAPCRPPRQHQELRQGHFPSWRGLTRSSPSTGHQRLPLQAQTNNRDSSSSPVGLTQEMPISPSTSPNIRSYILLLRSCFSGAP